MTNRYLFIWLIISASLLTPILAQPAGPSREHSILAFVADTEAVTDWGIVFNEATEHLPECAVIHFPAGKTYPVRTTMVLGRGMVLRFGAATVISGIGVSSLFTLHQGDSFYFEGEAGARLEMADGEGTVLNLTTLVNSTAPDLTIHGLHIRGANGLSATTGKYNAAGGSLGALSIFRCRFETSVNGININQGKIRSVRVEDSEFTGKPRTALSIGSPVSEGVIINGNRILEPGRIGIRVGGGPNNMVNDGAINDMHSVNVHHNLILGGGRAFGEEVSYIHGIIVYGNTVCIEGNIVRDFHRGEPYPIQSRGTTSGSRMAPGIVVRGFIPTVNLASDLPELPSMPRHSTG